jgi:hypothetical protein
MRAVIMAVVVVAGSMMACGGGEDSAGSGGALCQKVQACNLLRGASVAECNALVDRCLDQLLPGQRQDWNANMNECLKMQSCANFIDCFSTVPGC